MKILYLSTAGFPSVITHTLSMLRVCKAMREQGHEVLLCGRRLGGSSNAQVFDYYGMPRTFDVELTSMPRLIDNRWTRRLELPGLYLALRFRAAIRRFQPDLVYSRLTLAELFAVPRKTPLVYEMHSPGALAEPGLRRRLFQYLMRTRNVRHIVVTTETLKSYLQAQLPGVEIRVARLSAEPPIALPEEKLRSFRENTLQGQAFDFHVGYTGFLNDVRGIDVMIRTAVRSPDVAFHIVGGPAEAVTHWRQFTDNEGSPGNVFFYGHRPAAEIPWFLGCFDVCLTTLQEPDKPLTFMSPLKIPQYLAYGKPIVASDVLPHQEQLVHEQTALMVAADDADAWAAAVQRLRDDPDLRARLSRNTRAQYDAELTPQRRLAIILGEMAEETSGSEKHRGRSKVPDQF